MSRPWPGMPLLHRFVLLQLLKSDSARFCAALIEMNHNTLPQVARWKGSSKHKVLNHCRSKVRQSKITQAKANLGRHCQERRLWSSVEDQQNRSQLHIWTTQTQSWASTLRRLGPRSHTTDRPSGSRDQLFCSIKGHCQILGLKRWTSAAGRSTFRRRLAWLLTTLKKNDSVCHGCWTFMWFARISYYSPFLPTRVQEHLWLQLNVFNWHGLQGSCCVAI